jgi:hypothetical protein
LRGDVNPVIPNGSRKDFAGPGVFGGGSFGDIRMALRERILIGREQSTGQDRINASGNFE